MRFLIDAQLPPALARWLVAEGHEAEHVADRGLRSAEDREIWKVAENSGAILVTKDGDFAVLRTLEKDGPVVVWIRLGNSRRRELLDWMGRVLPRILDSISSGENLIEVA